jgi:hypothetical protein
VPGAGRFAVKTKTKKVPLLTEILLGRTVKDVCDQLLEKYEFENSDTADRLEDIVKTLVKANKPNVVFYARERDFDAISPINLDWEGPDLNYWDYDNGYWKEEEAWNDCDILNKIVEDLFGKRTPHKATKGKEFLLKKKGFGCPCCGGQGIHLTSISSWSPRPGDKSPDRGEVAHEIGCTECGYTWTNWYKVALDRIG